MTHSGEEPHCNRYMYNNIMTNDTFTETKRANIRQIKTNMTDYCDLKHFKHRIKLINQIKPFK